MPEATGESANKSDLYAGGFRMKVVYVICVTKIFAGGRDRDGSIEVV